MLVFRKILRTYFMDAPLMLFENDGTSQKWHMTNTPPEIGKYDTHKNGALQKWLTLRKKCPEVICQG